MPTAERNAYPNLILLCGDDHTLADKDHGIHYSVEQLHKMNELPHASRTGDPIGFFWKGTGSSGRKSQEVFS
jgi:hypothetical protein